VISLQKDWVSAAPKGKYIDGVRKLCRLEDDTLLLADYERGQGIGVLVKRPGVFVP